MKMISDNEAYSEYKPEDLQQVLVSAATVF